MNSSLANKKILLLYTAHTMGHQRMAENIAWWLKESGAEVVLREVLKSNPSPLVQKFLKVHVWVNTYAPWFWKFLYDFGFWFSMPFRLLAAQFNSAEIKKIIEEVSPDAVITTQTSPSAVMSVLKREKFFTGLWGISFSDYHFHRYWVYPRADFYLTNIPEQSEKLNRLGVPSEKIFRVGMALPTRGLIDSLAVRNKLGIKETDKVVLVGSGTLGVRLPKELLQSLDSVSIAENKVVLVLCGRNEALYQELSKLQSTYSWLRPLRFYEPMAELYAISNLMVSKPGGLTIAETIQWELPVFVTHYLPGQEELNIIYLEVRGAITSLYNIPVDQWPGVFAQELRTAGKRINLSGQVEIRELVVPNDLEKLGAFISQLFHTTST